MGVRYFENREYPGGPFVFGEHNSQHITANRKAYAMWWLLARITGWGGMIEKVSYPNPDLYEKKVRLLM